MANISPEPASEDRSATGLRRIWNLFSGAKLPAWAVIILQVITLVPDWKSRYDFWSDAAKSMGGNMGEVAAVLVSPYFRVGSVLAAALWLVFVGEPKRTRRHPIWGILGWTVAGLIFAAVLVTAGYGAFEIELRRLANDRAIEIVKGNQSPGINQGQDINVSGPRNFSNKQIVILIQELSKLKNDLPILYLTAPPGDPEAYGYRSQFTQYLSRTGIQWIEQIEIPDSPDATGIMVAVRDPDHIPEIAQKVREAFEVADIHVGVTKMPSNYENADAIKFLLFFGPRPLLP